MKKKTIVTIDYIKENLPSNYDIFFIGNGYQVFINGERFGGIYKISDLYYHIKDLQDNIKKQIEIMNFHKNCDKNRKSIIDELTRKCNGRKSQKGKEIKETKKSAYSRNKEKDKAYYKNNIDKIKKAREAYYIKNKEKISSLRKEQRKTDKYKEYRKAYNKSYRDKIRLQKNTQDNNK